MSRKRPTADQMGELMAQPHFRRDETPSSEAPSNTPVTTTPMLVDVDQVVTYDRNPRRTTNAEYEQLKAYIRVEGFNTVLAITQRPDTDRPDQYMIAVGGNTRLTILQELWRETSDERFRQVWCQFQPWENETHALVAHIQDNDLRGDLTFIDRALALQELRDLLESEAGMSLSQRQLRDQLAERGYQIGRTMIGWYDYTANTLYPLIPTLLATGLGRTTIMRIHKLQQAFDKAWKALDLGGTDEAQSLFEQAMSLHDGDVLDLDALRRDLEEELSMVADCDLARASLELGGALYGRSDSEADAPPAPPVSATDTSAATAHSNTQSDSTADTGHTTPDSPADTGQTTRTTSSATTPPGDSAPSESSGAAAQTPPSQSTSPAGQAAESPATPTPGSTPETDATPTETLPDDVKSLRSRTWTLASRIAQGSRLGDIVVPIHGGLGFLVGPIDETVQQSWHPDIGRTAMCVWWHLATLAEQFARHGQACAVMPDSWQQRRIGDAMRQARDGQQAFSQWQWTQADRALFADVPPLEPNDMGPMLYQGWPTQRWNDWIALVETYRAIYQATGDAPWGSE